MSTISSDDEDMDCPLCMEEIDITDKYFKPCPCGYQICRFCWNHIKEDLNGLCPACRRPYSDQNVEFKPVPPEEIARIKALKKKREREKKEQDAMSRRHLSNVRVVQKNLVYVLGLPSKIATEEILRSHEYFGQYGKIIRVVVNRKAHGHAPVVSQVPNTGIYITFSKEEAARAIEAVDGSVYDGKIIRATYGSTKYCTYFLKNQQCQNPQCQFLHEAGEEAPTFEKDEVSRMHMRERNPKPPPFPMSLGGKRDKEESALPPTASWAKSVARPTSSQQNSNSQPVLQLPSQHFPTPAAALLHMNSGGSNKIIYTADDAYDDVRPSSSYAESSSSESLDRPEKKSKGKAPSSESHLAGAPGSARPTEQLEEEEPTMGSSALDDATDMSISQVGPAPDTSPAVKSDDKVQVIALPSELGFTKKPIYTGPFNPFRDDMLQTLRAAAAQVVDGAYGLNSMTALASALPGAEGNILARPDSRASMSDSRRSRFERFFNGTGQYSDGDVFEGSETGEKQEDKSGQESFRAMFPNINVSFANGNLSEGEAQWGDSFSPSKLGVQESSTSDSWAQGQAFNPLRSQAQMPYQQTPALRGTGAFAGLSLQQQEQLLQQQQYLSSIGNTQQLPPQMINQLQQLRLLQQRQQQQQQQQQFPGLQHSIHPHQQPQEDQLGQYLREAQLRETLLRQEQLRDLQMRGTAQGRGGDLSFRDPAVMAVKMNAAGSGVAPGFEGRGRLGPSQSQALAYQQDWPPSPGASVGLGQGYANNGEYTWGIRGVRSRG